MEAQEVTYNPLKPTFVEGILPPVNTTRTRWVGGVIPSTVTTLAYGLALTVALSACSIFNPSPTLRPPLPTNSCRPPSISQHNQAGIALYNERRLEEAKAEFLAAVADGPKCAEAHYNLGLPLWYLGAKDAAREHFLEAANLAPGNQVIWDSPSLRPYSEPQLEKKSSKPASEQAPGAFGNRGRAGGY